MNITVRRFSLSCEACNGYETFCMPYFVHRILNEYIVLIGKPEGKKHIEHFCVDARIVLKPILNI